MRRNTLLMSKSLAFGLFLMVVGAVLHVKGANILTNTDQTLSSLLDSDSQSLSTAGLGAPAGRPVGLMFSLDRLSGLSSTETLPSPMVAFSSNQSGTQATKMKSPGLPGFSTGPAGDLSTAVWVPAFQSGSGNGSGGAMNPNSPMPDRVVLPEPNTLSLIIVGLAFLAWFHRRKLHKA